MHGVISLPDGTSYDKKDLFMPGSRRWDQMSGSFPAPPPPFLGILVWTPLESHKALGSLLGHIAWLVMCLTADTCLTANRGVASSILARSHTFVEIGHEIVSETILLPSADSNGLLLVTTENMCTKYWLNA